MKKVIKINGKLMGEVNQRNIEHFDIQRQYRTIKVESKKVYNRKKFKKGVEWE